MTDLATRIEQATGPDRVNDREIAKLYGWHRVEPRHTRSKDGAWISPEDWIGEYSDGRPKLDSLHGTTMHREVPRYTASIDAAMTLVPEGWRWQIGQFNVDPLICHADLAEQGEIFMPTGQSLGLGIKMRTQSNAATPALALCAAALRAREAKP